MKVKQQTDGPTHMESAPECWNLFPNRNAFPIYHQEIKGLTMTFSPTSPTEVPSYFFATTAFCYSAETKASVFIRSH